MSFRFIETSCCHENTLQSFYNILALYIIHVKSYSFINANVSLCLCVKNVVPAQPCVGKLGISLVLLNFLHCIFRLWFKTPQPFNSYPCHASEVTRNTLNHCLKFTVRSIFCHMSTLSLNYLSPRHQTAVFKVLICFKCS